MLQLFSRVSGWCMFCYSQYGNKIRKIFESISKMSSGFQNSRDDIKKWCHGENSGVVDKDDDLTENGHTVENSIIGQREKHNETEEFKRALEEELASREQAIKIQSEKAQLLRRLHKKRKAESFRLSDIKRRQDECVEELRSTQKKHEENMNLKEVIRAEVGNELNELERKCPNMASLLHSFGIQIENRPHPSPQQVQATYKRALLKLHPDKALKSDIREQVEAEEKFKLMKRFKEKL